jgi:3-carboxy-cis,cis-muconate cycloisomerase
MPQKRNPIASELIIAAGKSVRHDVALMLDSLAGADHERATGPWHVEWLALPRAFITAGGALAQAEALFAGLIVDGARMRRNLDATGGLIVAEAVMMALAPKLGRGVAHDLVYAACRAALDGGTLLADELARRSEITAHVSRAEIGRLCDPAHYLGSADAMITRALAAREA